MPMKKTSYYNYYLKTFNLNLFLTRIFENAGAVRSLLGVRLDAVHPPPDGVAAVESKI